MNQHVPFLSHPIFPPFFLHPQRLIITCFINVLGRTFLYKGFYNNLNSQLKDRFFCEFYSPGFCYISHMRTMTLGHCNHSYKSGSGLTLLCAVFGVDNLVTFSPYGLVCLTDPGILHVKRWDNPWSTKRLKFFQTQIDRSGTSNRD